MRVVCLLPSASDTLIFIGGASLIVGRSHECDNPSISHLPLLTSQVHAFQSSRQMHEAVSSEMRDLAGNGLYTIDEDLLHQLAPDVIITQSLCSVCSVDCAVVERIVKRMKTPPTVLSLNPSCLEDVIDDVERVGAAVGMAEEGRQAAQGLRQRVQAAQDHVTSLGQLSPQSVAFLEWTDPIFPAGHWTPQLISMAGGSHPLNPPLGHGAALPSSEIKPEALVSSDPDWVIICPCGLDLDMAVKESQGITSTSWWKEMKAVKLGQVVLVDGNQHFNRPGPRLVDALEWLVSILCKKPDVAPRDFPWRPWSFDATSSVSLPLLDIEELHSAACKEGRKSYIDPKSGYQVFTSSFLIEREQCCGNRCRHCPYGHFRVENMDRINVPAKPVLCDSKLLRQSLSPVLIQWLGDQPFPVKEIGKVKKDGKFPVLTSRINLGSMHKETFLLTSDGSRGQTTLSDAYSKCLKEAVPIIVVPQKEGEAADMMLEASEVLKGKGLSHH